MHYPVLLWRLQALADNLDLVSANLKKSVWQPKRPKGDARAELLEDSTLWIGLEHTVLQTIQREKSKLEAEIKKLVAAKIDDKEVLSSAWKSYDKIRSDSQSLLRECLEIIGTLAIRDKDLDQKILRVADELIGHCFQTSKGILDYYLIVHGLGDAFSETHAHIVRLRFPEWSIWDLPLAAHEFGHVLIAVLSAKDKAQDIEDRHLSSFLDKQQELLKSQGNELSCMPPSAGQADAEWAQRRVRVLVADALATYLMGPAYACSAIMLRLSPFVGAQHDNPSDAQRAHVVISMLRWMNDAAAGKPYSDVIKTLEEFWDNTLLQNGTHNLNEGDKKYLAELAKAFGDVSLQFLHGSAMYPPGGEKDGWLNAMKWALEWQTDLKERQEPRMPAKPAGSLRDVLNATWFARLNLKEGAGLEEAHSKLAKVGRNLCDLLISPARSRGRGLSSPSSPAQRQ
jgi:hypothetical protein